MCQLCPVPFHGDTIFCITHDNQPFTAMKPIVKNMGLDWKGQYAKLAANKARWGMEIISIPSQSGEQETVCMPVRKLPAYLTTINPKKVRPELREKIRQYQDESDDVLWNYWTNRHSQNTAPAVPAQVDPGQLSTNQSRKPLRSLVSAWAQMTGCPHSTLWPQVKAHFQLESIKDLPEAWLPDALAFVQAKIDALSAGLPEPEPALPALPAIQEGARMELEAIDKRKEPAAWVADQCLQKALAHLDHAFQHAGLLANTGDCPIEGYRPSLYIAAMSNINSAAAIVRAMISAEGVRLR